MITLECMGPAFTYRWPGGEVRFEPGIPVDLPDDRARRVLSKAPGRVRVIAPTLFEPGSTIAWVRGDGSTQTGIIDFIHADETGTRWAFVLIEDPGPKPGGATANHCPSGTDW